MSDTIWKRLRRAFMEDHRVMTRGFRDLLQHLRSGEVAQARAIAEKLDVQLGAHIRFEEEYLYPRIRESRGDQYADHLYAEHREMLAGLTDLKLFDGKDPATDQLDRWKATAAEGLEHAATCGTLLSQLKALPESDQAVLMNAIEELREASPRWSTVAKEHAG